MATEVYVDDDAGIEIWNGTEVASDDVIRALRNDPLIASLTRWQSNTQGTTRRVRGGGSLVDRDRYVTPHRIFDQFRVAQDAVESDDTVAGWIETTENLAFSDVTIDCDDMQQQDVWNQWAEEVELDERMREMYRGFATYSQVYCMVWWGPNEYKVQARTKEGNAPRKTFSNLIMPNGITFLDPLKVVPVGNLMFNQEQLAYIADVSEVDALDAACAGDPAADATARMMVIRRYIPDQRERRLLAEQGIETSRLYVLNPRNVWRHTATRMQNQRWAALRLKPILELLDLKHQLRGSDRSFLVGACNFLLVVTLGSDKIPAKQGELNALSAGMKTMGRVPLIVGDHRLEVKIVVPPQEHTLSNEKWATVDARVTAYLYRMFMVNHSGSKGGDDQVKVAKIVSRGLQASRKRQGKAFYRKVLHRAWQINDELTAKPAIKFSPRRIDLDFDPGFAQLLLDIYDRGDSSRDTMLSLVDLDQADEAAKKKFEKEEFDDVFQTVVPFSGPGAGGAPADPKAAGRAKGGNRSGGGAAPGSGQGQPPRAPRTRSGDRRVAAEEEDE